MIGSSPTSVNTLFTAAFGCAALALSRSIRANVGVRLIENVAMNAMRLCGFKSRPRIAVAGILSARAEFEMASPDAVLNLTNVVDLHSFGYSIAPRITVGVTGSRIARRRSFSRPEMPIPLGVAGACPDPTVTKLSVSEGDRAVFIDVLPETFTNGQLAHQYLPSSQVYQLGKQGAIA